MDSCLALLRVALLLQLPQLFGVGARGRSGIDRRRRVLLRVRRERNQGERQCRQLPLHVSDCHLNHGPNFSGSSLSIPALRNDVGSTRTNTITRPINSGKPINNIASLSPISNAIRIIPATTKD
ncbi:protein of unknown function [Burkholderia multivorans]